MAHFSTMPLVTLTTAPDDKNQWAIHCARCGWLSFRSTCARTLGAVRVSHEHGCTTPAPMTDAELDASFLASRGGFQG